DKNDGYYDGLRNANNALIGVSTGPITDNSKVTVTFLVLNSGHTPQEEAYSKALKAISGAGAEVGGPWGYAVAGLGAVGALLVGANCDGAVAADSFTLTGQELRNNFQGQGYYNWLREYRGTDSPQGCGKNSNYDAIVQFTMHP